MFESIDYADCGDKLSTLILFVMSKAFDCLKWEFILKCLSVVDFVGILYVTEKSFTTTPKCSIINNNYQFFSKFQPVLNKVILWRIGELDLEKVYLGLSIPIRKCNNNAKTLLQLNLVSLLSKTKNILNLWPSRNLTIVTKITVVKS